MSTNNGGVQNLICDISNLVHDVSSLLCGGGGNTQNQTQPTNGSSNGGSSCVQTVIQHVLSEFCGGGNNGNSGSQPVSFLNPSGPSSGICDIVHDVKDIACDIVGLIPSGCGGGIGQPG